MKPVNFVGALLTLPLRVMMGGGTVFGVVSFCVPDFVAGGSVVVWEVVFPLVPVGCGAIGCVAVLGVVVSCGHLFFCFSGSWC